MDRNQRQFDPLDHERHFLWGGVVFLGELDEGEDLEKELIVGVFEGVVLEVGEELSFGEVYQGFSEVVSLLEEDEFLGGFHSSDDELEGLEEDFGDVFDLGGVDVLGDLVE